MTLVDVLITSSLVTIIFVGVFGAFRLGIRVVGLSQNKIVATNIANQQIETARSLPYEFVGTIGAVLPFATGIFNEQEIVVRNEIEYQMETRVKYIIDAADGVSEPEDPCPNDYKKMMVKVSWSGIFGGEVILLTDIAPEDLADECSQIGGVLSVSVFDAHGEMVFSPLINVINPDNDEIIDSATPDSGEYYFPLGAGIYKVAVTKDDYSQARSYGTDEITIPEKPHPAVIEGETTEIAFSIDKLSNFSINSVSIVEGEPVPAPNVEFNLTGSKIIGYDQDEEPVYKYSDTFSTNEDGYLYLSGVEWDSYNFSINPATGLDLSGIEPSPQPVDLLPDSLTEVILYIEADNSLLLKVEDSETEEPIFSATAMLSNQVLFYNRTQYTDENGQTFFIPLEGAIYDLQIEAPGYSLFSDSIAISGDTIITVRLERIE